MDERGEHEGFVKTALRRLSEEGLYQNPRICGDFVS